MPTERANVGYWHLADNSMAPTFVRYWVVHSGQRLALALTGLVANDPEADMRIAGAPSGILGHQC